RATLCSRASTLSLHDALPIFSTIGVDQHGPERLVSGLERFSCQVDAAAKESAVIVIEIGSVCHAPHPITDRADFSVPQSAPTASTATPGLSRAQAMRT